MEYKILVVAGEASGDCHAANLVNLTLGRSFSYENRRQLANRLERLDFVDFKVAEIGRGYPHAHILYSARRPAA